MTEMPNPKCDWCGAPKSTATSTCPGCGTRLANQARRGTRQARNPPVGTGTKAATRRKTTIASPRTKNARSATTTSPSKKVPTTTRTASKTTGAGAKKVATPTPTRQTRASTTGLPKAPHATNSSSLSITKKPAPRAVTRAKPTSGVVKTGLRIVRDGHRKLGIDPGGVNTGVVVRDGNDVLYAATIVRPARMSIDEYARMVALHVAEVSREWNVALAGVEGVKAPVGYDRGGRKSPLMRNALQGLLDASVVLGTIVTLLPDAVVVAPGGNGAGPIYAYPTCLTGRRPADLPGTSGKAGRGHEKSAYDVAGQIRAVQHIQFASI